MKIFFFLLTFLSLPFSNYATHITGGEVNYSYLGNNQYELMFRIYRDCFNGIPPLDNPMAVGVFDASNNLIMVLHIPLDTVVSPVDTGCNISTANFICNEMGVYLYTVTLAPRPGGYQIAYQRCCRPQALTNIANPMSTGSTFYVTIPDSVFAFDSNPVFNNLPVTVLCKDIPFSINSSASDIDGDSISYSLITPLHGGDPNSPIPDPPSNPPYQNVSFAPPFTASNILTGTFTIDASTGIISGTATSSGLYAYAVEAQEFRNGVLIGRTMRDFQIFVQNPVGIDELENNFTFSQSDHYIKFNYTEVNISSIELSIYDVVGNKINSQKEKSSSGINFETSNLQSGIYFYELRMSDKVKTGKFIVN